MSDFLYNLYRQNAMNATSGYDLASVNIKMALVRIGAGHYVANQSTDQFLNVIAGGDIIATTANFTSVTTTLGVLDAANTLFASVAAGPAGGALVIYIDTGTSSTSPLVAYIDSYSGLPVTPNGSDIDVTFDTGANKIFRL